MRSPASTIPIARALLAELGYKGEPVKIWSAPTPQSPDTQEIMEFIDAYLRDVGIVTEFTPIEFGAFRPRYAGNPQNFETSYAAHLHINAVGALSMPLLNLQFSWASQASGGLMQLYFNPSYIDTVLAELKQEKSFDAATTQLLALNKKAFAEYAFMPVAMRSNVAALGTRVKSWSPTYYGFGFNFNSLKL
jgi:ABC-type transport system substrate-binding protein